MLNALRDEIHLDACRHGLWRSESAFESAVRIGDEVNELKDASTDPLHYAEELADVIIMALSVAGHLGIDIDFEVHRKMGINYNRPYGHRVIEK